MSHDYLLNVLKGRMREMDNSIGAARCGIVTNSDPYRGVRVAIDEGDPENGTPPTITGWLPVSQFAAGNGWSGVCYPEPGTQVFMVPDMADQSNLVVVGSIHSSQQPPGRITPYKATDTIPLVPGEITFMHPSGASLRLTAGGVIETHGILKHDGPLITSGNISDLDGEQGTLDDLRQAYLDHKHPGVQPGGGTTGTTDHPTP